MELIFWSDLVGPWPPNCLEGEASSSLGPAKGEPSQFLGSTSQPALTTSPQPFRGVNSGAAGP